MNDQPPTDRLSYSDIWKAYLAIGDLIRYLDFMMLLRDEHRDAPGTQTISLIDAPREATEKAIDEFLAQYREQFISTFLCKNPSEDYIREQARPEAARLKPRDFLHHWGCARVVDSLSPGKAILNDYQSTLDEIAGCVTVFVEDDAERLYDVFDKAAFLHLDMKNPFGGRRDLLPQGEGLRERYADYLQTRQHLCETFNHLRGVSRNHPEFAEVEEEPEAHTKFNPPLSVHILAPRKRAAPEPASPQKEAPEKPKKVTPQTFNFGENWANVSMEISQWEERAFIINKRSGDKYPATRKKMGFTKLQWSRMQALALHEGQFKASQQGRALSAAQSRMFGRINKQLHILFPNNISDPILTGGVCDFEIKPMTTELQELMKESVEERERDLKMTGRTPDHQDKKAAALVDGLSIRKRNR